MMTRGATSINNHLDKVICQMRYSPLFSIDNEIGDFQLMVESEYPVSGVTVEPQIPLFPTAPSMKNYSFGSNDGHWTINITNSFLALTTDRYTSWEEFRTKLQWLLDKFEELYKVSSFQRIGLRYVNAIRPSRISADGIIPPLKSILDPSTMGMMNIFENVDEYNSTTLARLNMCMVQSTVGTIRFNDDGELGFLIDNDLFVQLAVSKADIMKTTDILNKEAFSLLKTMLSDEALERMV